MMEKRVLYPRLNIRYEIHLYNDTSQLYDIFDQRVSNIPLNEASLYILTNCEGILTLDEIYNMVVLENKTEDKYNAFAAFIDGCKNKGIIDLLPNQAKFKSKKYPCIKISGKKGYFYPYSVSIDLTNQCNLRCVHCYKEAGQGDIHYLPIESAKIILDALRRNTYQIQFTGGEPMLHPHLAEILEYGRNDFRMIMVTNGLLINRENAKMLAQFLYAVQVTMYGYDENSYLTMTQSAEGIHLFKDGVKALVDSGCHPTVNIVVNLENIDYLQKYIAVVKALGVYKIRFGVPTAFGRALESDRKWIVDKEQLNNILIKIKTFIQKENSMKYFFGEGIDIDYDNGSKHTKNILPCGAGRSVVAIGETGIVRPCSLLPEKYFPHMGFEQYFEILENKKIPFGEIETSKYIKVLETKSIPIEASYCLLE